MSKYTRGLLAVILAVVLVLPAAAFAMLPEANARSSTGMDGPTASKKIVDPDTTGRWQYWASGGEQDQTTRYVGRIWTDKTVEPAEDEKSDFVTTLSTMSSTSDTTSLVTKPLDIVMVLDASGSMDKSMGGNDQTKRITALKNAASSFIDAIAEQNAKIEDDSKQHQVAIVKFAGTRADWVGNDTYWESGYRYNYSQTMKKLTSCKGDDATSLKSTVNSISPNGATHADYGLQLADGVFSFGRADAKKIVVFFTDGSPTSSSEFQASVADSAVKSAKSLKNKGADIYTIGIFDGANPAADPTNYWTSNENKFMHAVSSNYPNATSYTTNELGKRTENSDFYKAASNADELKKVFDDISSSITSGKGSPTQIEDGYDESKSGYITFSDELGDFMQVDTFVSAQINGVPFDEVTKTTKGNTDTYEFSGVAKDLVITVERSANAQQGDIVTVKIPASLIPLIRYHVDMENGIFERTSLNDIKPIQIKYTSSVKDAARNNLFTPDDGLKKYIEKHKGADNQTVYFLANKWSGGELGDVVAEFEPADTNSYYYFQKITPIYTDKECTQRATVKPQGNDVYYYKDEFVAMGANGKPKDDYAVVEFEGHEIASYDGALVKDDGYWSFNKGTARLAYIDQLHTTKDDVEANGNKTETARDVLNPRWNDLSSVATSTHVHSHLGNNGKIIFSLATKPTTVDTKTDFGLTKVLEGRKWADTDAFEFELSATSDNNAPMPDPATVTVTNADLDKGKAAINFGKITYAEPGEYTYEVREVKGDAGGITYSKNVATFKVTVTVNAKGELKADVEKTSGETEFKNTYSVKPVEDQITAKKVLTGRDLKEGEFSFELVEDGEVVATGTNAADGTITMGAVKYDKPDKHTYTLREANGGTTSKGITYSNAKYTIVTTITDKGDGTLKAEHVLKGATPATFENTYSVTPTDADLDFGLSKAIDGREWTDGDEFSFTITAPDGAPLPNPATVTVSNHDAKDGIASIKFGKIHYTAAGTYKYEIRENAGSTVGMTYDAHVATAEVTVTEDGDGTLTANVTKKENGRFTNTYRTELNYTAAGGLKLSKTLRGRPMTEGQFTFTVTPADEASANALGLLHGANEFKSPATAEGTVGLIDILAGHEVKFTQADAGKTFKYTVVEKNDSQPGYTYDDAVRTVTIAIADDTAGTLTATTTVSGGSEGTPLVTEYKTGAAAVESAVVPFVNSYSATTNTTGGEAAKVVATKTLTGRPMADGEFYFGIAYAGEKEAIEGTCTTNINGQVSFGFLHYTTEMLADLVNAKRAIRTDKDAKLTWTIGYTAFEFTPQLAAKGITAATPSFSFKVIVVDNGDGTLTAKSVYDGIKPLFENVYGTDAVDAALAGTKKLQAAEGLTPADIAGKFTFTVAADEAGAPMPEHATATNDAAGNVDFGKIHFTLDDLNRALGVTDDAADKAEADEAEADEAEADEANADEADVDVNADESEDENESTAATPRSHTFTYTVTESGSAPGVTNDANATRKVSYTVTDDGAGHLSVVREGADGAAFTFTNTYSVAPTDSVVTDQVKTVKRLTGRDLAAGEFTFDLLEDGVVVASGTNDANGTVTLSPIHYEAPGTHTYTLREACPNALGLYKGVTYDGTTYTVVTTVSDNGDGTLTATHKLEGTTESAGFTNKYHAMPTQVSIGAIKVLEGRELKKDEFSFKLVGEDIESTVTNDADGKISFDKFEYSEPGTYVYTISEVKGDETGMTYDKSVYTATVNVVDGGEGNLKASVAYTKGDKSVEGIVFNNTYKKPETPVPTPDPGTPKTVTNIVKTVKGYLPTTGDQQAAALLMAFVIAMAGVGALVWGIRKR